MCQWVVQAAAPHEFQILKGLASAHSLLCVYPMTFIPWITPPTLSILSEYEFWCVFPHFREWCLRLHLYSWFLILFRDCDYLVSCEALEGSCALKSQIRALKREFLTTFASLLHSASELETSAKYPESLNAKALIWPWPLRSLKASLCTQPSSWFSAWLSSST